MTPTGLVVFTLLALVAIASSMTFSTLAISGALVTVFGFVESGGAFWTALRRSLALIAMLVVFMVLLWVVFLGSDPNGIVSGLSSNRIAALVYVTRVSCRLFFMVALVQAVVKAVRSLSALDFIGALHGRLSIKKLILLTLSLIFTIEAAISDAWFALVAANIVRPRRSIRNMRHSWILVQTVYLSALTTVAGRLRDKWPIERTVENLDEVIAAKPPQPLSRRDRLWLLLAVVSQMMIFVEILRR